MNDRFEDLRTFVAVVQAQSFKGAAERLGLVKSAVSRRVRNLEDRLGVQLLSRTTRAVRPTEIGNDFYWRGVAILANLQEAEQLASTNSSEPLGRLKVAAPASFVSLILAPALGEFVARNPKVSLEVHGIDRDVDLVGQGFDVAIVAGPLRDSRLIARRLCDAPFLLVAAPSYWDINGRPGRDAELTAHRRILHAHRPMQRGATRGDLTGEAGGPCLSFDNDEAIRVAILAGAGVAQLPAYVVLEDVDSETLEPVACEENEGYLSVVYPSGAVPAKVRAFIDFVVGLSATSMPRGAVGLSRRRRSAARGQDGDKA